MPASLDTVCIRSARTRCGDSRGNRVLGRPETYGVGRCKGCKRTAILSSSQARGLQDQTRCSLRLHGLLNLEKRRAACHREVEVNRRWAPDLYLGLRAITRRPDGTLAFVAQARSSNGPCTCGDLIKVISSARGQSATRSIASLRCNWLHAVFESHRKRRATPSPVSPPIAILLHRSVRARRQRCPSQNASGS